MSDLNGLADLASMQQLQQKEPTDATPSAVQSPIQQQPPQVGQPQPPYAPSPMVHLQSVPPYPMFQQPPPPHMFDFRHFAPVPLMQMGSPQMQIRPHSLTPPQPSPAPPAVPVRQQADGEHQFQLTDPKYIPKPSKAKLDAERAKRPHKRTFVSLVSCPKIQHIKKKDGEALWREDIQYDFLHAVFTDATPAFRDMNKPSSNKLFTFADVYLNAMAHSTKCSRVLSEKLVGDRDAGVKIAMVCLLVNLGRMNTTLNFFPEMKTLLRTYHPIPSLQTHDSQDYKQLQDAPRLKSILKGTCETAQDSNPNTLDGVRMSQALPRTNPISLVFSLAMYAQSAKQELFPDVDTTFFDLVLDTSKVSQSRARAFLWLMWAYLEASSIGDHSNNPFGSSFPHLETIDPDTNRKENVDTPAEQIFGNMMTLQRLAILSTPSKDPSEKDEEWNVAAASAASAESSPAPGTLSADKSVDTRTSVSLCVPKVRLRSAKDKRINHEFLSLVKSKRIAAKRRRLARNNAVIDTWRLIGDLDPIYDSDDDMRTARINGKSHGIGTGLLAKGVSTPYSDIGEYCSSLAVALRRLAKRIDEQQKR